MKLKKLFVVILALLVVLSFAGCGGSGGGSDDDPAGGTDNGDNGGNGGGNGGGDTTTPWLITYIYRSSGYLTYIDFIFDGSSYKYYIGAGAYNIGDGTDDVKMGYIDAEEWCGTFTGDPRIDGTITVTGVWFFDPEPDETTDYPVIITSGTFLTEGGQDFTRQ